MSVKYIKVHKYFWVRIVPGLCVALMHPPTPRLLHWRLLFSPSGHASFESRCTFARSQCHTFCGCFKYFLFQLFQIIAKYAENSKTRKAWILPLLHFQFCTGSHKQEQTQANMTSSKEIFLHTFSKWKKTIIWKELWNMGDEGFGKDRFAARLVVMPC